MDYKIYINLRLHDSGAMKAVGDASLHSADLGSITVKGLAVMEKAGQAQGWVSFPSTNYEKDGKKVYKPVLELPAPLRQAISKAVMAEYERQRKESFGDA